MLTDTIVMEAGGEWATACEVQQRFMRNLGPAIDTLDYSARCRQAQELGGDCFDFVPLDENRLAFGMFPDGTYEEGAKKQHRLESLCHTDSL